MIPIFNCFSRIGNNLAFVGVSSQYGWSSAWEKSPLLVERSEELSSIKASSLALESTHPVFIPSNLSAFCFRYLLSVFTVKACGSDKLWNLGHNIVLELVSPSVWELKVSG